MRILAALTIGFWIPLTGAVVAGGPDEDQAALTIARIARGEAPYEKRAKEMADFLAQLDKRSLLNHRVLHKALDQGMGGYGVFNGALRSLAKERLRTLMEDCILTLGTSRRDCEKGEYLARRLAEVGADCTREEVFALLKNRNMNLGRILKETVLQLEDGPASDRTGLNELRLLVTLAKAFTATKRKDITEMAVWWARAFRTLNRGAMTCYLEIELNTLLAACGTDAAYDEIIRNLASCKDLNVQRASVATLVGAGYKPAYDCALAIARDESYEMAVRLPAIVAAASMSKVRDTKAVRDAIAAIRKSEDFRNWSAVSADAKGQLATAQEMLGK